MAEVVLKNVSKTYDVKKIIDNVSLDIKDKEFLVLVGASGCGKSTLLRMIAGLEDITEGEIYIEDKCVNNVLPKDRNIAFVFQNYALYPHMSVYENIAFPLKMRKFKKDEIDKKVKEAAKILDLEQLLNRKPKQLSGGQRQRVALGRAIVRSPKVFLMDEPLSNLDAKLRVQMRAEIKKLHKKLDTTFIYVTHDQTEALTMGDRIAVIDKGVIQQIADAKTVYNEPDNIFVAGFLGSPSMNFVKAKIQDGKIITDSFSFDMSDDQKKALEGKLEVILGIRPDNFNGENCNIQFEVEVEINEMLGSENIVYFNIGEAKCCAKLPAEYEFGKTINLGLNSDKLLLFDPESTNRL